MTDTAAMIVHAIDEPHEIVLGQHWCWGVATQIPLSYSILRIVNMSSKASFSFLVIICMRQISQSSFLAESHCFIEKAPSEETGPFHIEVDIFLTSPFCLFLL